VHRFGPLVALDITANAYLLHMVRNVAAALEQVGSGSRPEEWSAVVLKERDRRLLGPTGPPRGLYLVDVRYPTYPFPDGIAPGPLRALGPLPRF
jgi:tRNA pseudouridine38-40 synthase